MPATSINPDSIPSNIYSGGPTQVSAPISIHRDTAIGTVRLTVSDLDRSRAFYQRVLGLAPTELDDGGLAFGPAGRPLVELRGDRSASRLDRRATGLYHLAILVPNRRELALSLMRIAQMRWPLDGASDHLVSEALYLSDPDGNGIEIYRDRPREQWRRVGDQLEMATLALDLADVLTEIRQDEIPPPLVSDGTSIGHVHLQVSDIAEAEAFYSGLLGFDVVVRGYPGALFVSAGGYHHHVGLNTWHSAGASPALPDSVGLRSFEIVLPDEIQRRQLLTRIEGAGLRVEPAPGGAIVRDPSGNAVMVGSH
jgi:catechol 2,3-dioxygenase